MTDAELIQKGAEAISMIVSANPECTVEQLMFKAYMGGVADGGKIVATQVEAFAVTQKAKAK